MPRIARVVVAGVPHHVTQRGNRREDVFFCDADRQRFLQMFLEYSQKHGLTALAYCLMTNHVHFVCVPRKQGSLAATFKPVNLRYAQHVNWTHELSGRLWQGRFYSCALDERHFWLAMRYVELNPVRARLCRRPWRYEWSSAAAHTDERAKSELLDLSDWYGQMSAEAWRKELIRVLNDAELAQMRLRTHTGRPLGSDSFLSKLEARLGRRLRALPPGRPRTGKPHASRGG